MMDSSHSAALKRLRRKLEILKEDFKRTNTPKRYDIEECLLLLNVIEAGAKPSDE